MPKIEVVATADVSQGVNGLKQVQAELGKTAIAAQKSDAGLAKMGNGISNVGNVAKKAATQVGSMVGTLVSGGLITAVTLSVVALFELGKSLFDVSEQQKKFNEVLEGAKSAYVKAVLEVDKMRDAFDKARSGVISKESALKLYNSTIGKTIGQTNDLDIAEKNFIANAENYIKYTLLKSAANIALGKAAEAAFEAEKLKLQGPRKVSLIEKLIIGTPTVTTEEVQQKQINDQLKNKNSFQEIYNSLIKQANSFGFTGIEQEEKTVKVIKAKTAATKEYVNEMKRLWAVQSEGEGIWNDKKNPLSLSTGSTIEPNIIVKPKITFIKDPERDEKVLRGIYGDLLDPEKLQKISDEFDALVQNTIISSIESSAELVGEAIANFASSGKFDLPNLFGGLMQNLGSQIQQLGKFLITSSGLMKAAKEAFKTLLANPVASAIVGVGLIALGAALKASASKQFKGFASGGTVGEAGFYNVGERGQERVFLPQGAKVQPNNQVNAYGGGSQVFIPSVTLQGPDLVIAFNRASQQMGRNN